MNFWKSATLLRVRISSSLSLRSRGCTMFIRCSLCGHVIHPTVASSVRNATSATMRSSRWTPLIVSLRIRASSKGRTLPNSTAASAFQIAQSCATHTQITQQPDMKIASIPWAAKLGWLIYANFFSVVLGDFDQQSQTDLSFGMQLGFIGNHVHATLQVSVCSGYDLFQPGWHPTDARPYTRTHTQTNTLSQSFFEKILSTDSCLYTILPPERNNEVLSKLRKLLKYQPSKDISPSSTTPWPSSKIVND